ncbi:MAG: metalloregulator ArsR/SmtB family transcription factor [Thiohalocapsa sp.]
MGMSVPELAARLEALGHETRLTIFRLLVRAGGEGMSVGAVQHHTELAASTLSHHLHKLISVGLVSQRREGRTLYCCPEYPMLDEVLQFLRAECCVDADDGVLQTEEADRQSPRSDP